jgi:hypothetical protein
MIRSAQTFAAVLCVTLAAMSDQSRPASTTLPATKAAATAPASPLPVLESIASGPNGFSAVFVVPLPDGRTSRLYVKEGDTFAWINRGVLDYVKVLDFGEDRVRVSRSANARGGGELMNISIGNDLEGRPMPPSAPPPLNPALLGLGTDDLFAKCLAAAGNDYMEAKAVVVSRPKEAEALAKKILDTKDASWQQRVLAQALAEEVADPKAYTAARMELVRVAHLRWQNSQFGGSHGSNSVDGAARAAYQTSSENLFGLLAKYPGLKGEMILKSTADFVLPLVAEIVSQSSRRRQENWQAAGRGDIPAQISPEQFMKTAKPNEPAALLGSVRSQAALACARVPNAETRSLLGTLDPKEYASVLADCDRLLQGAATKPTTGTQPTHATSPAK